MARKIEIPLSINPRELIRGLKLTEREFEDLEDVFKDVEQASEKMADGVEGAFRDIARDADRAAKKIGSEGITRELGDIEDEANQSAKEFGASFRGDPVEALEEVQSYLSEIVAVQLPGFAGAAATIAGGAALGLIVSQIEKWREQQEAIKQKATELWQAYRDVGSVLDENNRKQQEQKFWQELSLEDELKLRRAMAEVGLTQGDINDLIRNGVTTQAQLNARLDEAQRYGKDDWEARKDILKVTGDTAKAQSQVNAALYETERLMNQNQRAAWETATAAERAAVALGNAARVSGVTGQGGRTI